MPDYSYTAGFITINENDFWIRGTVLVSSPIWVCKTDLHISLFNMKSYKHVNVEFLIFILSHYFVVICCVSCLTKKGLSQDCFHVNFPNISRHLFFWSKSRELLFNPFVPNVPFLCPPVNIRKPLGFLMFSGSRERLHGNKWVNRWTFDCVLGLISSNLSFFNYQTLKCHSKFCYDFAFLGSSSLIATVGSSNDKR